jgi:hypothetical protein
MMQKIRGIGLNLEDLHSGRLLVLCDEEPCDVLLNHPARKLPMWPRSKLAIDRPDMLSEERNPHNETDCLKWRSKGWLARI